MINKEVPVAIRRIDAALMAGTPAVMGTMDADKLRKWDLLRTVGD